MGKVTKTAVDPFAWMIGAKSQAEINAIDASVRNELCREAELDVIVQPIIDARVLAFLGSADEAATIPSHVYFDTRPVPPEIERVRHHERKTENRRQIIRQCLHPALKKIMATIPSVGMDEILAGVEDLMGNPGAHRPQIPLDPVLVRAAHDKIQKARPTWSCRAVCEALAERLDVSRRTIENLRRRPL